VTTEELMRLFSVLSHDLKSPLFAVDGFAELLIGDYMEKLDEEGKDFLLRVRSSAQSMKRIIDQMSHLVKLIGRPIAPRPTPLRELFEEVLLKQNFAIEEGAVRIDVPEILPTVNVDPEQMRELIGALISNALFFTDTARGERTIAVSCSDAGALWKICVRDNGIGIDPRYAPQVFELGGMSKLDKSRGGGPGYGLYLARRIAELHGGTLTVESTPGEGSTFCFTIPKS
jgi:signal transduction histidine kinase